MTKSDGLYFWRKQKSKFKELGRIGVFQKYKVTRKEYKTPKTTRPNIKDQWMKIFWHLLTQIALETLNKDAAPQE